MLYETLSPFEDTSLNKRIPPLSLELHFVYGFQSSEKRSTLFYAHSHRTKPRKLVKQDEKDSKSREDGQKANKEGFGALAEEEDKVTYLSKEGELFIPTSINTEADVLLNEDSHTI